MLTIESKVELISIMVLSCQTDKSGQTVSTQTRLLLKEQFGQGLHYYIKPHCSNLRIITSLYPPQTVFGGGGRGGRCCILFSCQSIRLSATFWFFNILKRQ